MLNMPDADSKFKYRSMGLWGYPNGFTIDGHGERSTGKTVQGCKSRRKVHWSTNLEVRFGLQIIILYHYLDPWYRR